MSYAHYNAPLPVVVVGRALSRRQGSSTPPPHRTLPCPDSTEVWAGLLLSLTCSVHGGVQPNDLTIRCVHRLVTRADLFWQASGMHAVWRPPQTRLLRSAYGDLSLRDTVSRLEKVKDEAGAEHEVAFAALVPGEEQ